MLDLIEHNSEICVIGRTNFSVGIGVHTYAACELLSQSFPICIYTTDIKCEPYSSITLPNGRIIPTCEDLTRKKVFFYVDVLWNGAYDLNYTLIPNKGFRIAYVAWDSDEFPSKWVQILNDKFDLVLFTCRHLEEIAVKSGVKIAIGTLPLALDLETLLSKKLRPYRNKKTRFGTIAAFHQRKGLDILVEAFLESFGTNQNVELIIHSNLAIGDTYEKIIAIVARTQAKNVILSHQNLDEKQKIELLESIDIFVNCSRGEGYSIGPREALALGKLVIVSDIAAHQDLKGVPGVFAIPTTGIYPARYPEIDNQIFGRQFTVNVMDTKKILNEAFAFYKSQELFSTATQRKMRAAEFSFSTLSTQYAEIINPEISSFRKSKKKSAFVNLSVNANTVAIEKLGSFCSDLNIRNRLVIPVHDGGFFSIFNVFMSHLVWNLLDDRCHMVLPDWDVSRFLERANENKIVSFCYGQPKDKNVWLKFFEPLYGLTSAQMNDEEFLYQNSVTPEFAWNEDKEPLLTYVNAYDLYKSASFANFRKQYYRAYKEHITLLPKLQKEIDGFAEKHFSDKFMIAVHVKHPSHVIEQPGMQIAKTNAYIELVLKQLSDKNIAYDSDGWSIFLATDQDKVIHQFNEKFGNKLHYFTDVRRTSIKEDALFESLSPVEQRKEGFQIQHIVASSTENWSSDMAWEVIRDVMVMAQCNILLHVVSNVSTAVSYINPDIELVFCS